jgi:hypothetical protein
MSRRFASLLLLASAGCIGSNVSASEHDPGKDEAAKPAAGATGAPDAAAPKADANKLDDLAYAAAAAERKVVRARQEAEQSERDQAFAIERSRHELDDARKAVQHFEGFERPNRLAKAELELKDANDYLTEQDEEMRQLELLYEKDDLGDKTKEIVLARGRRRHGRAQERLEMAKRDFEDLRGFELTQQGEKLARELAAKERDLARAEWSAGITKEDKQQAIEEAERALVKAKREHQEAGGGVTP